MISGWPRAWSRDCRHRGILAPERAAVDSSAAAPARPPRDLRAIPAKCSPHERSSSRSCHLVTGWLIWHGLSPMTCSAVQGRRRSCVRPADERSCDVYLTETRAHRTPARTMAAERPGTGADRAPARTMAAEPPGTGADRTPARTMVAARTAVDPRGRALCLGPDLLAHELDVGQRETPDRDRHEGHHLRPHEDEALIE